MLQSRTVEQGLLPFVIFSPEPRVEGLGLGLALLGDVGLYEVGL